MKKIGLFCLCLASLSLFGCFHIPDEDWLPSRNKVNTGDIQKNEEMEQAINSFIDGINMISSEWDEMKNEEIDEITTEDEELEEVENESINSKKIIDNEREIEKVENEIIEDDTTS